MTVLVKLPIGIYQGFMGRRPLSSRKDAILKNSLIIHKSRDEDNIEFLCRIGEAKLLLDHAWQSILMQFLISKMESALRISVRGLARSARPVKSLCSWQWRPYELVGIRNHSAGE
jgi:hypothetical protein